MAQLFDNEDTFPIKTIGWGIGAIALVFFILFISPFTIVSVGERAIVLHLGNIDRVLSEGVHWVTPFTESVVTVDITTQKDEVEAQAASKDLQNVTARIAVNYQVDPSRVAEIYSQYLGDEQSRLIAPSIQEAVKAATAKYTAEELITKREIVRSDIVASLKEKLTPANILVSNVNIINFNFSEQFNQAIESKVRAEQDALAQKNLLEKVKYEAEQRVATARAEAESIKLQSDAANNEKYVSLKRIEVQLEVAKRWNGQLPTNMYAGAPLPLLDITK
jgi:regulator of protease activity HflC (stomatin/prohibitin superfamily)